MKANMNRQLTNALMCDDSDNRNNLVLGRGSSIFTPLPDGRTLFTPLYPGLEAIYEVEIRKPIPDGFVYDEEIGDVIWREPNGCYRSDQERYHYYKVLDSLNEALREEDLYWKSLLKPCDLLPLKSRFPGDYSNDVFQKFELFLKEEENLLVAINRVGIKITYPDILGIIRIGAVYFNYDLFSKRKRNKQVFTIWDCLKKYKGNQKDFFDWLVSLRIIIGADGTFPEWLKKLGGIRSISRSKQTIFNSYLTDRGIALVEEAISFYQRLHEQLYSSNLLQTHYND